MHSFVAATGPVNPRNPALGLRLRRMLFVALGFACTAAWFIPYLAPHRAASLAQDRPAIEFVDRNGLSLGTLLSRDQEHTASAPLNRISARFLEAIVAAEDRRFYRHGAVDGRALARAVTQTIRNRRFVSGASTIDMQLARMLHPGPPTVVGKLWQIWEAQRIDAGMTKDEILEAYVNRLPMGGNVYGVEAAARAYFGHPAADLDLAEGSLLAAVPNDPTNLNPYEHRSDLKRRQAYVLGRMVEDGYTTRSQADRALAEELHLQPRRQGILAAAHLLFWLADRLPRGVTRVRTTIDRPLQDFVEEQVRQVVTSLTSRNVHHAAALVIDNRCGEVLAYVGSPDYFSVANLGRNDGVQALRQPGSALKPFLYELALESRAIRPTTILADVPAYYPIPDAKLYSPSDYSGTFMGPVRVRVALANSLNVPAVRVLERVGVTAFLERLHGLGFEHLDQPPDYYGLGLTLGGGEVSLWELARAYATMARLGRPAVIEATMAGRGPRSSADPRTVGDAATWQLVTDILADGHARAKSFGVGSILDLPFAAAVKTGTSSDFRDTWTVGFTRNYTVAVWVGNFDGRPMREVSGVVGAAPLWNRIMLHLHEQRDPAAFPAPDGLALRPICADTGLRPLPDCPAVVEEYFYPEDLTAYERQSRAVALSREYDEWLAAQPDSGRPPEGVRILTPHDGDRFVFYGAGHGGAGRGGDEVSQQLRFAAAAPDGAAVQWRLNGRRLGSASASAILWPLRVGRWTLEAKSGGLGDAISFEVRPAGPHPTRRGFSLVRPVQGG